MKHIDQHKLSDGSTLITIHDPLATVVDVTIMAKIGASHEHPKVQGISHLLEHLMFCGSKKYPGPRLISGAIEGTGGTLNGYTSMECTSYYAYAPADKMFQILDVMFDMYHNPLFNSDKPDTVFDKVKFETERGVVLQEISMYDAMADHHNQMNFIRYTGNGCDSGHSVSGTAKIVSKITSKQVRQHYRDYYTPERTVYLVTGPQNSHTTISYLEQFLKLKGKSKRRKFPGVHTTGQEPVMQKKDTILLDVASAQEGDRQCFIHFGYCRPPIHPTSSVGVALCVASGILGRGSSSRLMMELREKRGLCYSTGSAVVSNIDSCSFIAVVECSDTGLHKCLDVFKKEFKKLASRPVPKKELDRVIQHMKGGLIVETSDCRKYKTFVNDMYLYTGTIVTVEEYIEQLEKVTVEDVRCAMKVIMEGPFVAAVRIPEACEDVLTQRLLKGDWRVLSVTDANDPVENWHEIK